ncbi:hypothetical protein ACFU98_35235 [Streptomyces sp. NPDC057575]|uniref:hypothetical protein n=1 Tax=unclassified Streptomyces TaxID=2593676 RepID=UPI0036D0C3AC
MNSELHRWSCTIHDGDDCDGHCAPNNPISEGIAHMTTQTTTWPEGVIARYLAVGGATVDLAHGARYYPTADGIGETRNHTSATCVACPATAEFSHWRVVKRMTFDDKVHDPNAADEAARAWAQEHAEKCRAMPKPTA